MSTMITKRWNRIAGVPAAIALLLLSSVAFAQTQVSPARKFDEFNDIQASDLIARLDNLAIELQNQPAMKAYLIVYRTRRDLPGLSNRYAQRMKGYLIASRGLSPDQIVTVDGGVASCLTQEIWIVPRGSAPPPRSDAVPSSYQPSVYKFDEHSYSEDRDLYYWRDSFEELLEAFGLELQRNPKATGYLVAYRNASRDGRRTARAALQRERNLLMKHFGIKPGRLKTIEGGYREWRTMELWVAQERGAVPIITWYRGAPARRRR